MERWAWPVLALLLAVPLAGCMGGDGEGAEAAAAETNQTPTVGPIPEGRGPIAAFEETNATEEGAGGLDHHHDYWEGRERVQILDERVSFGIGAGGGAARVVRPPMGVLVFERTGSIELLLTAPKRLLVDDPSGTAAPTVSFKHAAATDWIEAGDAAWGEPLVIRITDPAHTDMPHATWSLWEFRFQMQENFVGPLEFQATAEIVRGEGDIPLWPGHPAFYTESSVRRVLDTEARAFENGIVGDFMPVATQEGGPVSPEKVVSYGTRTLHVFVNITRFDVTNPLDEPTNFYLRFHNASNRWNVTNLFDVENHGSDKTEHVWVLKVTDSGMDSPYADASRWEFELGAAFMQGAPGVLRVSCYRNCATWSAEYTITALATTEELPDDRYDAVA